MESNTVEPIEESFLSSGDLFGLKFNRGIVFLEVEDWEQNKFAPYTDIGEIEAESSSGFQRLEFEDDDILYSEKSEEVVLHAAIGQTPSFVRRYTNYPDGENRLRRMPNLGTPTSGDPYGYVDGEDSPYESPTVAEELFVPPGEHLNFNFYNPNTEPVEPVISIVSRQYNIRPLSADNAWDRNAITRIVNPGSPMPVAPAGGPNRQTSFDLSDNWGVEPISYDDIREEME